VVMTDAAPYLANMPADGGKSGRLEGELERILTSFGVDLPGAIWAQRGALRVVSDGWRGGRRRPDQCSRGPGMGSPSPATCDGVMRRAADPDARRARAPKPAGHPRHTARSGYPMPGTCRSKPSPATPSRGPPCDGAPFGGGIK